MGTQPRQKPLTQKKFVKGLIAVAPTLAQVPNSVPQITNMVYTVRGGLRTCDGSSVFSASGAGDSTGHGTFLALNLYDKQIETVTGGTIPTTKITNEPISQSGSLKFLNDVPSTLSLTFFVTQQPFNTPLNASATDNGSGQITGTYILGGTINYQTGQYDIILKTGYQWYSSGPNLANYSYYSGPTQGATVGITNVQYELGLQCAPARGLGGPVASLLLSPTTGTLAAATYKIFVSATDLIPQAGTNTGFRETSTASASITLSVPGGITATWSALANAAAYVVYILVSGSTAYVAGITTAPTLTISAPPTGALFTPPTVDSTQTTVLRKVPRGTYDDTTIISTLPASIIGGSTQGFSLTQGYTVNGGQLGVLSPLPQIVNFTNLAILILGNGIPPMSYADGGVATTITNGYVVSYPSWAASTAFQLDDLVLPASPNGYYYQCTQAGVSGSTPPTWPTQTNQVVNDGTVQWTCMGSTTATALRGAAHAVVYAGFLWLWNTYPATTTDNLDGPSCLKMSTLQNAGNYDPLNVAFVDKDDGDQGMGMSVFSISEAGIAPTNNLVLFKSSKSYVVAGVFGASNFSIQRIQTDMGCIAPRSIQFVPGLGIVRLSHLGFATTDGISDRDISEEVRPYLFGGDPTITPVDLAYMPYAQACQTANPPMYICGMSRFNNGGAINTLFCYDLVQLCWTVIDLPFNIYSMSQIRSGPTGIFVLYPTQLAGFSDGIVRNWQYGDQLWDTGAGVEWSFKTPEVYSAGGADVFFLRKIRVRGVKIADYPGSGNPTLTLVRQGTVAPAPLPLTRFFSFGNGQFNMEKQVNERLMNVASIVGGFGVWELELLEWDAIPKPTGVPLDLMH